MPKKPTAKEKGKKPMRAPVDFDVDPLEGYEPPTETLESISAMQYLSLIHI